MFRTKICGITSATDAELVSRLGGEVIGLNFYAQSSRYVGDNASDAPSQWGGELTRVGVFVNAPTPEIRSQASRWSLDVIQFHGDEPPEQLAELAEFRQIKAFRVRSDGLGEINAFLSRCDALGCVPAAVLVDAWHNDAYGGSGTRADWELLARHRSLFGALPLILAGGLDPANVAEAIVTVRPDAVDVASGVESSPGVKDARKTAAFLAAASAAFSS